MVPIDVASTGYISNQSIITGSELIRSIVLRMYSQQSEVSPLVHTLLVSDEGCSSDGEATMQGDYPKAVEETVSVCMDTQ